MSELQKPESSFLTLIRAHKKLCIILLIAFLAMLLSGSYYLGTLVARSGRTSNGSDIELTADPNLTDINNDYLESFGNQETEAVTQDYFKHHCFTNLYFVVNQLVQEMPAWNDLANNESMIVELYVVNENSEELVFDSGIIPPGKMLSSISLSHAFTPGVYQAIVITIPISTTYVRGCSLKSFVTLYVK